ncbi:MAG: dihydrolipoyllysine-residue succinyltransferase [Acidobacteriota bacterium]
MRVEVKVPTVGESITEGLLAEWLQADGAVVRTDDPLFVLETDKVTMTINAEHAGRLAIAVPAGSPVKIGQTVGSLDTSARAGAAPAVPAAAPPAPSLPPAVPQTPGPALNPVAGVPSLREKLARPEAVEALAPAVRRLVEEHRLDPAAIRGTGRDGRVTKEDVVAFLASGVPAPAAPVPTAPETPAGAQVRRPLSPIRSRIAERMVLSQQTTATLTTFAECDCGAVMALRKAHKEAFLARHGVALGFMGFFVKAVADALRAFPDLNSWIEGAEIVENREVHIGIAVAAEQGLAVPVLRHADRLSLAQIESEILRLAARVREKKITLAELSGGTFSITNAGSYGALMGTPILNPPQSGILGTYAIQEKPVVREGQIVVRPVMILALSYDHRMVDGKTAGLFLKHVADFVGRADVSLLELDGRRET